ncbi:Excinuclease ABC subunit A [Abditibacterium utsteinense]|uniref:UvrABC system protein A n=1 Tax=Abditibacterium utsteinense TaxID=1960156 RepID=A0A2S8SU43_9BACT|nr:excinuclease ABC subunit UvrA [Abditibacterium utsteinense]PQV64322.1 Excinuclease ABC subunit A [Abditibacterium utsteinense]
MPIAPKSSKDAAIKTKSPAKTPRKKAVSAPLCAEVNAPAPEVVSPDQFIIVKGARQHNLKNIDINIPRHKLITITGLSGSGKSSLAFDTIYAEGQRRYVESLSAYARQFLGQMDKPDVDFVEGLSPAISIDQKTASRNPRSTVATVTEVYDYLRLLFARAGTPHCPKCGRVVQKQSAEIIVDKIMALGEGTRLHILAPLVRGRKGEYKKVFEDARKKGFARVRVNGEIYSIDDTDDLKLERYEKHDIEVVVDRIVLKAEDRSRIADSVQTSLKMAEGVVMIEVLAREGEDAPKEPVLTFSEAFACPYDGESFEELEPRTFSFNSPYGACPECVGLGSHLEFDPQLCVPDARLSLDGGALAPWRKSNSNYKKEVLRSLARDFHFSLETPWSELTQHQKDLVLQGTAGQQISISYVNMHGRRRTYKVEWEGVLASLKREYAEFGDTTKEELQKYMSDRPCRVCKGARLKPWPLGVTIADQNISDLTNIGVGEAALFFGELRRQSEKLTDRGESSNKIGILNENFDDSTKNETAEKKGSKSTKNAAAKQSVPILELTEREAIIARPIVKEIQERLQFLVDVGLDYLTLDRTASTLSGGEAQRIRLATQIGSGLVGVLYVLDEPSIGLHQRDNEKLIATLKRLKRLGNTVIVVEHDEDTMRASDHIVDIGPAAGELGGRIVAQGTLDDIIACEASATGRFLSGKETMPIREVRREPTGFISIKGAREHNLKNLDVDIPLGTLVCVTGVSGSGKSTLIEDILFPRLAYELSKQSVLWGKHDEITGLEQIDKIINIDQSPIGRTPRSNPATYTGAFTPLRELFTVTREAKLRGYGPGRFSFNVKGGRCENCQGDGIIKIEMHFLPDVYVPCEVCAGKRYGRETLEVKYKGHSIADILDMTVAEALETFEAIPALSRKLQTICDVGLGYIRMGQPATTLSGGEAQRVKLATELAKRSTGHTLYILDEPSVGLHMADVKVLIEVLQRLTDQGNTILVIEHNLDLIACADYLIDLGPEGGAGGGKLVAKGTPEEVMKVKKSYTGQFLKAHLDRLKK